jgi:L-asparaginase
VEVDKFRTENGFESFSTEIPQRRTEYEEKLKSSGTGTVGCVADQNGKIAAATSTGGKGFEVPRISDSATLLEIMLTFGVSLTGVGEDIMSNATAAATRVTDGFTLEEAFAKTFEELKSYDGFAGAIAIDSKGIYSTMILILVWFLLVLMGII